MLKSNFFKSIKAFLKNNWVLILILLLGLFLRLFRGREMFTYNHDQDLAGWIIKDIVVNKHLRLIGQLTSTPGIFIGPYFYYLLIPFYLLFKMDPFGGFYLVVLIGIFTIWSFYFVLSKVFNKNVGLISAFIYAVSIYTVMNDRWMVPTMPVFLWSVWMFYSLNLLFKGKAKGFILAGILVGLIWELNFALVLTTPLLVVAVILSKKRVQIKSLMQGLVSLVLTSLPLIIFEVRHNYIQTKALFEALTTKQSDVLNLTQRFEKVIYSIGLILKNLFLGNNLEFSYLLVLAIVVALIYLILSKTLKKEQFIFLTFWALLYIGFFSIYSKILSEYYLDGMVVLWVIIAALILSKLLTLNGGSVLLVVILAVFSYAHLTSLVNYNINRSGYIERKEIVKYINYDRQLHNYPCVAVSYITDPGYSLGYRYFFWLEDMHVEKPQSNAPVYSIVFPLSRVERVDKYFGALGLILPDYPKYNEERVKEVCSGQNSNLTDSMFGYTE